EALERGAADDPALRGELLRGLAGHTRRLARLADDLLETARLETGRLHLARTAVAPEALLRQAAAEFAAEAAARQVILAGDGPDDLPPLDADTARLGQALANLVENALRHTPPGTTVRLAAARAPGAVALSVADAGPGFPAAAAARLAEQPAAQPTTAGRLGL